MTCEADSFLHSLFLFDFCSVCFFGSVRTTKAFLPLLKTQAIERTHEGGRIVQISSMAGLLSVAGRSSYHAAKFAVEGFTNALRDELRAFNVQVVTVNPAFHKTPFTQNLPQRIQNVWNKTDASIKNQYGEGT
jgi:NAD(P)-dependent dehydrogenase (short-subunit alcohol dehydrogenase family)